MLNERPFPEQNEDGVFVLRNYKVYDKRYTSERYAFQNPNMAPM